MDETGADRKQLIRQVFGRAAPTYDGTGRFAHFGRRLVEAADLAPGAMVLDVACGRGAVLFPAAEAVGPSGLAIGIDLSEGMVDATAAEAERRGLTQSRVRRLDAEQLDYPTACFDAVLCGFGLRFFPHLNEALAGFRRVLRPNGVFVASDWGERDPHWDGLQELRRTFGVADGLAVNRFDDPGDLELAIRMGGFARVQVWTEEAEFTFKSEAEWWGDLWSSGPRSGMERLDPDALARFQREGFDRLRDLQAPDGSYPERRQAMIGRGSRL